jgi:ACR3 family arsenite efflux pump ArsB
MSAKTSSFDPSVFKRSLLSAVIIASLFSVWTYLVNASYSPEAQLKAALTQCSVSLIFGFSMTLLLELWLTKFERTSNSLLKFAMPVVLTMGLVILITVTAHWIMQTPEILKTILLPACAGILFCSAYSFKRSKSLNIQQKESSA